MNTAHLDRRLVPGAARFVHVFENEAGLSLAERRQVAEAGMSGRFYAAYFRDLDGNKLNCCCMGQ